LFCFFVRPEKNYPSQEDAGEKKQREELRAKVDKLRKLSLDVKNAISQIGICVIYSPPHSRLLNSSSFATSAGTARQLKIQLGDVDSVEGGISLAQKIAKLKIVSPTPATKIKGVLGI
jgi:hypothetical protein